MMKILELLFFLILTQTTGAQIKVTKLDQNSIPKNIKYNGNFVQAARWNDSLGNNITILSTDIKPNENDYGSDGHLYAYHYLVSADSVKQTWKVYDYIKECPVDMFLYFIDKTFAITDLNKDGRAETWIMYKVSCQGDVSPVPMKLIMYEHKKKFAVRGTTRVKMSATKSIGGEFIYDEAFKNAPAEFRQYAAKLWQQNIEEHWKQ